jgi:hypothetical protein
VGSLAAGRVAEAIDGLRLRRGARIGCILIRTKPGGCVMRLFLAMTTMLAAIVGVSMAGAAYGRPSGGGAGGGACNFQRCLDNCIQKGGTNKIRLNDGCSKRCSNRCGGQAESQVTSPAGSRGTATENCKQTVGRPNFQACMQAGGNRATCKSKTVPKVKACVSAAMGR